MPWKLDQLKEINEGIRSRPVLSLWVCLTILFGIAYLLTPVFTFDKTPQPPQYTNFFIGILIFGLSTAILFWVSQWNWSAKNYPWTLTKTFFVSFSLVVLVGLFYLVVYYPGTGMIDTLNILVSKDLEVADQHPWSYVYLNEAVVKLVKLFGGGYEAALVVLSLIQIFLTAVVYSYCIVWLQKKGLALLALIPIALFLIFCPFLDIAMVSIFKDMLFSLLMIAWMPVLYDCWATNGKILRKPATLSYLCLLIVLSLVRNNGIYVVFLMLIALSLAFLKDYRKQVIVLWVALACTIGGNALFEKANGITHLFKETVGIPLQQIGGVVYYGGDITSEEEKFVNSILPIYFIKKHFDPYDSNQLKWGDIPLNDEFINDHKYKFLWLWVKLAFTNPKIYIEVYLKNTYGFWSLDNSDKLRAYTTIFVKDPEFANWFEDENIHIKDRLPPHIQTPLENFLTDLANFVGEGTSFWIFIALWITFGLKNGPRSLIVGSPIIANWLTIMVATPLAFQYRYVLCTIMALPVMLGMLLLVHGQRNKEGLKPASFIEFALEPNPKANSK